MSRRSTPERLDTARREATRARIIGAGSSPERADDWIARYARQAASEGREHDAAYWDRCYEEWAAQRR